MKPPCLAVDHKIRVVRRSGRGSRADIAHVCIEVSYGVGLLSKIQSWMFLC